MVDRVAHNSSLYAAFMRARGVESLRPPIHKQLPGFAVNRHSLRKNGYNGSILVHGGRTLMAYRYHPGSGPQTKLALAELDSLYRVVKDRDVDAAGASVEDPRLFLYRGAPWISYTVSSGPVGAWKCVVRYGRLVETDNRWVVEGQYLLPYGKNDETGLEKNWVFFEHDGKLRVIYDHGTVLTVEDNVVTEQNHVMPARWNWGTIRGGSGPMKWGDRWIRFFHSRVDTEPRPIVWRYFVGAMVCDPYEATQVSRKPILWGSEVDAVEVEERREIFHHKQNVVFPGGAIAVDGGWLLSVGVNDCHNVLVKVTEKDLNL